MDTNHPTSKTGNMISKGRKHKIYIALLWALTLILIITDIFLIKWIITSENYSLIILLVFGLIQFILVFLLDRCLYEFRMERVLRYRLAFFLSVSLPVIYLFLYWICSQLDISHCVEYYLRTLPMVLLLSVSIASSFIGALFTTWSHDELIEDNHPPRQMIEEVLRIHKKQFGVSEREPLLKDFFDVFFSLIGMVISSPVWCLITFMIWIEDPGPVLFIKNSVGLGGVNVRLFKFRTMLRGEEENTGQRQSQERTAAVLKSGRLLRKTALDELPQLINILRREMSFVGPRPHRTSLVFSFLKTWPEFSERHGVIPGLAGLAQVAGDFYMTPIQKLRYDRLYIKKQSILLDFKLLWLAFLITFWYRWKPNWNGRLPRKLLHL